MGARLVLCYHAVSPTWPASLSIPPERLETQLEALLERGYRATTFSDALTSRRPGKVVALTFDDGYRSVFSHALPILTRYGMVGTAFVPTSFIGRDGPMEWRRIDRWIGGPHERELIPMSWGQLHQLVEAGWEIGSHTRSHPHLTALDDDRLSAELAESRADCEDQLGVKCTSVAYPYGDVDRRVIAAARRAGYLTAAGLPARTHRAYELCWPRVGVWQTDPESAFKTTLSPLGSRWRELVRSRRTSPAIPETPV